RFDGHALNRPTCFKPQFNAASWTGGLLDHRPKVSSRRRMTARVAPLQFFDHFVEALLQLMAARPLEPILLPPGVELSICCSDGAGRGVLAPGTKGIAVSDFRAYAVQHGALPRRPSPWLL